MDLQQVVQKVRRMVSDPEARRLASNYGLSISEVTWEDCGRFKNSAWGPCISDMTLQVGNDRLPVIRSPNFEDLTWDVAIEKINVTVGNEIKGSPLYSVSLKEYLQNLKMYLSDPGSWAGPPSSLLADRDSHVVCSSQACFLPIPKGAETSFNVALFNYQTTPDNPAILSIVSTRNGTSAQVVDESGRSGQKLYFNRAGDRASFVGQRLTDNRIERGVSTQGAMTQEEREQNVIMIFQVPLKQRQPQRSHLPPAPSCAPASAPAWSYEMEPSNLPRRSNSSSLQRKKETSNVEDAIIKVGEASGKFSEIRNHRIERDARFPIRLTLQFYKSTDNGVVDDSVIQTVSTQIKNSRKNADFIGSLVVGGNTNRPTEPAPKTLVQVLPSPPWWDDWWLIYRGRIPHYSEQQAREIAFCVNTGLAGQGMQQATPALLRLLKAQEPPSFGGGFV